MSETGHISSERENILKDVLNIVNEITVDFEINYSNEIHANTRFVKDLDFESTDVIELFVAVRKHYKCDSIPFQNLVIKNNRFVDFTVGELVDFLYPFLISKIQRKDSSHE